MVFHIIKIKCRGLSNCPKALHSAQFRKNFRGENRALNIIQSWNEDNVENLTLRRKIIIIHGRATPGIFFIREGRGRPKINIAIISLNMGTVNSH